MNRDEGQYQLSHIFDEFLVATGSKSSEEKQSGNFVSSSSFQLLILDGGFYQNV